MLNEDLIGDEKDIEIARLKSVIERFKRYDAERKQYYAAKMVRLGMLESLFSEQIDKYDKKDLECVIVKLREQIQALNRVLLVRKIEENRSPEELQEILDKDCYKRKCERLKTLVKSMQRQCDYLMYKNSLFL